MYHWKTLKFIYLQLLHPVHHYALFQLIWCTHVNPGFTLKNRDVQWLILHRQVSVMLFKATAGIVERFCMIMLFGVLPLYVLCHVLSYLILSLRKHAQAIYIFFLRSKMKIFIRNSLIFLIILLKTWIGGTR